MAYFDSAKNRAVWQKELAVLKQERDRRAQQGYTPETKKKEVRQEASKNPYRHAMTFAQLEKEEMEAAGKTRPAAGRTRQREKERSVEVSKGLSL